MTPRRFRERVASFGLGLGLVLGMLAPSAAAAPNPKASRAPRVPTLYHKSRSFRIPFNVDPSDRGRLQEVQLWVSEDSGFTWKAISRTTPDHPSFTFRATRDAEYWFAVRTLDKQGRLFPSETDQVEPSMKVVVDTNPPSLLLEPEERRGSLASVRWEVRDEHLDLRSLVIEYQADGATKWRQVPFSHAPTLIGSESWDAGTAEPLRVRASIADKAGNTAEADLALPEGTPSRPNQATNDASDFSAPPPIAGFEGNEPDRRPGRTVSMTNANEGASAGPEADPFGGADAGPAPEPARGRGGANHTGAGQELLVPSPRFPLAYAVDDAGPEGPATVELWVTQDGGRTWIRRGVDEDRRSPFDVDLGGEGTFGLAMVARGLSGLGDQPPAPGDPPQVWVEVDNTPPKVQMFPPQIGTGANLGKVAIFWRATDLHLGARPVTLSWRPDTPGAAWKPISPPLENEGKFVWSVPPELPPRFHIRVDVVDTVGNRGSADTADTGPIRLDRTRPRSRIIGLDRGERSGMGPSARPLR